MIPEREEFVMIINIINWTKTSLKMQHKTIPEL